MTQKTKHKSILVLLLTLAPTGLWGVDLFEQDYLPSCFGITLAGDLAWSKELVTVPLGSNDIWRVSVMHFLEVPTFGRSQSRFIVNGINTYVDDSKKGLQLFTIGGHLYRFQLNDVTSENVKLITRLGHFGVEKVTAEGHSDNITVYRCHPEGIIVVEQGGWTLIYVSGALTQMRSPRGHLLKIQSRGGAIINVWRDDEAILAVSYDVQMKPVRIRALESYASFIWTGNRLSNVYTGAGHWGFRYDESMMLNGVDDADGTHKVEWKARGDHKPLFSGEADAVLAGYDGTKFEYKRAGEEVMINIIGTATKTTVRARFKNGELEDFRQSN